MSKKIRYAKIFFGIIFSISIFLIPMKVDASNIFETNACDDKLEEIKEQKVSLSTLSKTNGSLKISKEIKSLNFQGGLSHDIIDMQSMNKFFFNGDILQNLLKIEESNIAGKMYASDAINDILAQKEEELLKSQSILNDSNIVDISKEELKRMYLEEMNFEETNDTVYCTTNKLFVRDFPSIDSEQVSYLSYNESVTRIGNYDNGWSKIAYKDGEYFVCTSYLSTKKQQIKGAASVEKKDVPITYRGDVNLTDEQYNTLLILAMSEAGNTSYECTLACVETVLNRMAAGFGSFEEVIKAYYINYKKVPNQQCIDAVNQALTSNTYPSNMYYFRTKYYHKFGTPYMNIDNVYFSLGD